ncbi:MAG: hypothetical protein ACREXR_20955 [Gammaproteobacteria bacterium]
MWKLPAKTIKNAEDAHVKTVNAFGNVDHLRDPSDDRQTLEIERPAASSGGGREVFEL